jgi:hypothetical protein
MGNPNDYLVHDTQVSNQTGFTTGGLIATRTVVTFYVGTHGPFRLDFAQSEATAAAIQAGIDAQVQVLRGVAGTGASGA